MPRRGTVSRATGQDSAHGQGFAWRSPLRVRVQACAMRLCASHALAWIHAPRPSSHVASAARNAIKTTHRQDDRRGSGSGVQAHSTPSAISVSRFTGTPRHTRAWRAARQLRRAPCRRRRRAPRPILETAPSVSCAPLVGCSGRRWTPRSGATRGAAMTTRRAILAKRWQALGCAADGLYSPAMSRRIAIVEDDPTIRANYAEALRKHGFEVAAYAERAEALAAMSARLPDIALIDIGLGADIDGGFTLCRELRARSAALPIIFLTARDSDFDIVAGLRLGADDYLTKDVSLPHLLARIAALFRRADLLAAPQASEEILERGPLSLDLKRLTAHWAGNRVDLTLTEFWMVHALARFPGHVKDRDSLMRDAKIVVDDSTITSHIKRIRRKFQAIDPAFDRIDTAYGIGYRWRSEPD